MEQNFYIQKYAIWNETVNENLPDVSFISPLIRRRLTAVEKIGLYLAHNLEPYSQNLKVIFASQFGEWTETLKLIEQLHSENEMSPAGFSHSVHNAMPGILSIITKNENSYTTVAANSVTIDNALVEAFISEEDVLFIYAEEKCPQLYAHDFNIIPYACGFAFILSKKRIENSQKIQISYNINSQIQTQSQDIIKFLTSDNVIKTRFFKIEKT